MKLTPEDKLILNAAAKQGRKEYLEKKKTASLPKIIPFSQLQKKK